MGFRDVVYEATDDWLTPRRAVGVSLSSVTAVALVAATPGSPFHPELPIRSEPSGPLRYIAELTPLASVSPLTLMCLGLLACALAAVSFLLVLRACRLGMISVPQVLGLAIAYQAILLLLPLMLSNDVFNYAFYGEITAHYRANPYVQTPADFPYDPLYHYVWPGWRETPSVYGPVFAWMSAMLSSVLHSITAKIFGFKVIAGGATVATLFVVRSIAQRFKPQWAAYAIALVGLNPVIVFHTVGGGHVDALVMLAVASSILLALTRRELAATAVLTLGALVKVTAVVPLLLLVIYVVARAEKPRRLVLLGQHAGVFLGLSLLLGLPFLQMTNPTLGMVELVRHDSWMATPALVERALEALGHGIGGTFGAAFGLSLARMIVFAVLATGLALIGRQVAKYARQGDVALLGAAWGWALLLVMLASPTLFPWYFAWVVPLAVMLPRTPRVTLEWSCAILAASQLAVKTSSLPGWLGFRVAFGHPVLLILVAWFAADLYARLKYDVPLDVERIPSVADIDLEAHQA